jgi:hypothetical protein
MLRAIAEAAIRDRHGPLFDYVVRHVLRQDERLRGGAMQLAVQRSFFPALECFDAGGGIPRFVGFFSSSSSSSFADRRQRLPLLSALRTSDPAVVEWFIERGTAQSHGPRGRVRVRLLARRVGGRRLPDAASTLRRHCASRGEAGWFKIRRECMLSCVRSEYSLRIKQSPPRLPHKKKTKRPRPTLHARPSSSAG